MTYKIHTYKIRKFMTYKIHTYKRRKFKTYKIHTYKRRKFMTYKIRTPQLCLIDYNFTQMKDSTDPYGNDPARLKVLIVNASTPFNAETPLSILTDRQNSQIMLILFFKKKVFEFFCINYIKIPNVYAHTESLYKNLVDARAPV